MSYCYLALILFTLALALSSYFVCNYTTRKDIILRGHRQSQLAEGIRAKLKNEQFAQESTFISEGLSLAGLYFKRKDPNYLFIICHGYRFNKEFLHPFISLFERDNIFLFDFRTHGQSEGSYISFGCKEAEDVKAAIRQAKTLGLNKNNEQELPIVLLGISMGGAAVLKAAADEPKLANALVIDSTFASFSSMARAAFRQKLWFLPRFPFVFIMKKFIEYNTGCVMGDVSPIKSIPKVNQPTLLIHSEADELIPCTDSQDIQLKATSYCDLWITPPCKHGFAYREFPKQYAEHVYAFLEKMHRKTG